MFALLMLSAGAALPPRTPCTLAHLEGCRDTNRLVWNSGFDAALKAFLGDARGSYLYDDRPVAVQIGETLGGAPDDARRLAGGDWFFSACRAHSCTEKGAVVLTPDGTIRAAAILSFDCHHTPPGQPSCENGPTLTVFVRRMAGASRQPFMAALTDWATAAAAADRKGLAGTQGPFQGVVIRGVLDERDMARGAGRGR